VLDLGPVGGKLKLGTVGFGVAGKTSISGQPGHFRFGGLLCVLDSRSVAGFALNIGQLRGLVQVDKPARPAVPGNMAAHAGRIKFLLLFLQDLNGMSVLALLPHIERSGMARRATGRGSEGQSSGADRKRSALAHQSTLLL